MKKLSIVICTYNRELYIAESILAAINQTTSQEEYQVIVVNNNSKDRTNEICRRLLNEDGLQFDYFIETNQGNSYARNRGIKEATGNIIVFVDDDAIMESDYVTNLLAFYQKHPNVDAAGGRIYPRYEEKKADWLSPVLMPLIAALDMGNKPKAFRWGKFPIGANMSFRKQVFEKIGVFNVNLGRIGMNLQGGDEKDVFARMRVDNLSIWYCPDAIVHHVIPATRLEDSYIKRMGIGVGESEYRRTKIIGQKAFLVACMKELIKWGITFALGFIYLISFHIPKAKMLMKFRGWVSKGLFFNDINIKNT